MTGFGNKQYLHHSMHKIMCDFYHLSQGKHHSNQEYYDEFNSMVETAEESGVTIGAHPAGVTAALQGLAIDMDMPTVAERRTSVKTATERYLAVAFIIGGDKLRYGILERSKTSSFETKEPPHPLAHTLQRLLKHTATCVTIKETRRT
jgi:hypothetical protein